MAEPEHRRANALIMRGIRFSHFAASSRGTGGALVEFTRREAKYLPANRSRNSSKNFRLTLTRRNYLLARSLPPERRNSDAAETPRCGKPRDSASEDKRLNSGRSPSLPPPRSKLSSLVRDSMMKTTFAKFTAGSPCAKDLRRVTRASQFYSTHRLEIHHAREIISNLHLFYIVMTFFIFMWNYRAICALARPRPRRRDCTILQGI